MLEQVKEQIKTGIETQLVKRTTVPNFGWNFVSNKATVIYDWLKHDG
ncbi:hypothetical protein [Acinetobacter pittii]